MSRLVRTPQRLKKVLKIEKALHEEGFSIIAGVDESGRGPLAGPVVASAVIVKDISFSVDIRDCKRLTSLARSRAFDEILRYSYVGISIINQQEIDKLNIYQASILAMRQAVCNLRVRPDCLLVDGPYKIDDSIKNISVIGGDTTSLSIACASIVAKVVRDRIMEKMDSLYPLYGFKNHKGYGTKKHLKSIKKHGPSPIHRLSFYPFCSKRTRKI